MSYNSPEIQKFLDQAKEEAKRSASSTELIPFSDFWAEKYSANDVNFSKGAFLGDVAALTERDQVNYYKELTSYHKGISALVLPVKRVIRKLMAFLFLPVVAEQNEINLAVSRLFTQVRSYVNSDSAAKNERSVKELELERKVRDQQGAINELTAKIEELSAKISAIEKGGDAE
ncbi:MAG: hypothetical protein IJ071_12445 [Ruminococcus sp.]|nr:hypothetical protein [Ruminococcus sp.]